jgi:flagellin
VRINFNHAAMTAQRNLGGTERAMHKAVERLSSGLRINSAADDAAGLSVSQRLRGQIGGLNQAARNVQDAVSALQVTDGGLTQTHDMLQRMRELAVQAANGIYTATDRAALQHEAMQLAAEITRVGDSVTFNGRKMLADNGEFAGATPEQQVIEALRRSALAASEEKIERYFGLTGDGSDFKVILDTAGANPAYAAQVGSTIELHVNMTQYSGYGLPNGGQLGGFEFDRVIAHEMTHAVMFSDTAAATISDWFHEGAAEYIHGAEDRLVTDLNAVDGNSANGFTAADVTTFLSNTWETGTPATSGEYSASFAAVKYLDSKLQAAGSSIKEFFVTLDAGGDLDDAFAASGIWANEAAFIADMNGANGEAFIASLDLTDRDLGGVGGGTDTSTVADLYLDTLQPLDYYDVTWQGSAPLGALGIQAGANNSTDDRMGLPGAMVSAETLGVDMVDLENKALAAIDLVDEAIRRVSQARTTVGVTMNKLEFSLQYIGSAAENQTAAESRIRDTDVAATAAELVRAQILQQGGLAALAQANAAPNAVLSLLR